jgi:hypothetical protein
MWYKKPLPTALRCHVDSLRKPLVRSGLSLLIAITALTTPATLAAQESPCDAAIERTAKRGSLGYQSRGEHCEGMYNTDVAATMMWVASLTALFDAYDLDSTEPLVVSWTAPAGKTTHLRAHGIKRDIYYRMDAPREAGQGGWKWPTDVLAAQGIERDDIGVLGWVSENAGGVEHELFVPLSVAQGSSIRASSGTGTYEMVVVPNVRLQEVYVSLARVDAAGQRPQGDYIKKQEPLGQRVYATQRPIRIQLSDFTEPGIYLLEITATRADGRSVTMDPMWIYHAGW